MRELSRFQDELKIELRRVTNHLWQQLHRYYPQMLAISPAADDRLMWDLLEAAPTPAAGAKITSLRILRILKANRIRKVSVDEVHAALRTAPLVLAPGADSLDRPSRPLPANGAPLSVLIRAGMPYSCIAAS